MSRNLTEQFLEGECDAQKVAEVVGHFIGLLRSLLESLHFVPTFRRQFQQQINKCEHDEDYARLYYQSIDSCQQKSCNLYAPSILFNFKYF